MPSLRPRIPLADMVSPGVPSASRERSARSKDPGGASIGCAAWFWSEAQPAQTSVGEQKNGSASEARWPWGRRTGEPGKTTGSYSCLPMRPARRPPDAAMGQTELFARLGTDPVHPDRGDDEVGIVQHVVVAARGDDMRRLRRADLPHDGVLHLRPGLLQAGDDIGGSARRDAERQRL